MTKESSKFHKIVQHSAHLLISVVLFPFDLFLFFDNFIHVYTILLFSPNFWNKVLISLFLLLHPDPPIYPSSLSFKFMVSHIADCYCMHMRMLYRYTFLNINCLVYIISFWVSIPIIFLFSYPDENFLQQ